jgi:hypothetical protein
MIRARGLRHADYRVVLAAAVLIASGCGGRSALMSGVASNGTGGAGGGGGTAGGLGGSRDAGTGGGMAGAGGNRDGGTGGSTRSEVGAGGGAEVGADASRDVESGDSGDAGRDGPLDSGLDKAPDGKAEVETSGGGEGGVADGRDARDAGRDSGMLRLLAGGLGGLGDSDGIAAGARFRSPQGVASDGAGSLFVADWDGQVIRKIDVATGAVTTLAGFPLMAGSTDGTGSAARFNCPAGIASDGSGNLFVADYLNHTIRKIVIATREVTTFASLPGESGSTDGTGTAARFNSPTGITSDGAGNLYVTDRHAIRKIVIATAAVTTLAGSSLVLGSTDGIGTAARFQAPWGMASDGAGNLFVADNQNHTIRKVVVATAEVSAFAGSPGQPGSSDGVGAAARFSYPKGMASDGVGNLFVVDAGDGSHIGSNTIRKVVIATGEVTTLAGSPGQSGSSDGMGADARFLNPLGIAADGAGNLFVADNWNSTIRKIVIAGATVSTLAGSPANSGSADGVGAVARFEHPAAIAGDGAGSLFVADTQNSTIRKVVLATGEVSTLAGSPGEWGSADGVGAAARFQYPQGLAIDNAGNLFATDGKNTIRKIVLATAEVSTFAGSLQAGSADGAGTAARFDGPMGLATDNAGNLFVADMRNCAIRRIVIATAAVTTLAGSSPQFGSRDGVGTAAQFNNPQGVAADDAGNLFVADSNNYTIRKIVIATGEVTTLAGFAGESGTIDGTAAAARFYSVTALAYDKAGNLFATDTWNNTVRKIALGTQVVTTVVGSPDLMGVVLGPLPAGLGNPWGLALGPGGELLISDVAENAILVAQF